MAWPIAINALLMQGMLMIDTLLISPLGEGSLAAMGIASAIVSLMLGVQNALANGSQNVLSRAVGSGKNQLVSKSYLSGIIINLSVAVFFFALISLFKWPLIKLLSHESSLYSDIDAYLSIIKYALLLTGISQVSIALYNAMGKTKLPLLSYLLTMPINAVVSYYLINGLGSFAGIGVAGAALGSIFALGIRMVFLLVCLKYQRNSLLSLALAKQGIRRNIALHFKEISPIAANMMVLAMGLAAYRFLYTQLPTEAYAAVVMVTPWLSSLAQFVVAWAVSSAITISQAIGSNNLETLDADVNLSIKVTIAVSAIIALVSFVLSLFIDDIYPGHSDTTYQALATIAPLYILMPLIQGYTTVHGQVLRALGKTTAVFNINFVTRWVIAIPLCAFAVLVLDASIFWVYAITVFEQALKIVPMRHQAKKFLREFDSNKAKELMYD
ncbi:MATE family efflux transporter [Vibrio rarus]|uniref:MATE family efflux transporter n=1 Tax=Vibrio rarus TaxID=413403 RepID=UPI0021C4088A|nr:MATE family efflux transporter [Vibrio rarus]